MNCRLGTKQPGIVETLARPLAPRQRLLPLTGKTGRAGSGSGQSRRMDQPLSARGAECLPLNVDRGGFGPADRTRAGNSWHCPIPDDSRHASLSSLEDGGRTACSRQGSKGGPDPVKLRSADRALRRSVAQRPDGASRRVPPRPFSGRTRAYRVQPMDRRAGTGP